MAKTPKPRIPNQDGLRKIAQLFVHHQIVRSVGHDGAEACLRISVMLAEVLKYYEDYFNLVDVATVNSPDMQAFFPPDAWDKLNNEQKRKLQKAVEDEAQAFIDQVSGHMKYLETHKQHMELMSPGSAQLLEQVRDELLGIGTHG